jgi:hypothetical protein
MLRVSRSPCDWLVLSHGTNAAAGIATREFAAEITCASTAHFSQSLRRDGEFVASELPSHARNGETALNHSKQSLAPSLTAARACSSVCSAALLAGLALSAPPAHAAIPGLTVVRATTPWTSADKNITVNCPGNTVPLSAGFQVGGTLDQGRINITGAYPTGPRGISVRAEESVAGFSGNWDLQALAVCAVSPPGYQIISRTANAGNASSMATTASCPSNKVLLGTGMKLDQSANQVLLTALEPTKNSVHVEAQEDVLGTTSPWSLTGYAFCADPLPTHGVYEAVNGLSSVDSKFQMRTCPSGTEILGVGGSIENPTGAGDLSLFNVFPAIYSGVHAVFSDADETLGTMSSTNTWALHSHVICGSY